MWMEEDGKPRTNTITIDDDDDDHDCDQGGYDCNQEADTQLYEGHPEQGMCDDGINERDNTGADNTRSDKNRSGDVSNLGEQGFLQEDEQGIDAQDADMECTQEVQDLLDSLGMGHYAQKFAMVCLLPSLCENISMIVQCMYLRIQEIGLF